MNTKIPLPAGVNDVNMRDDGSRSVFMYQYGDPYREATIRDICSAWGVSETFDIDVYTSGKKSSCDYNSSRHFMLKFADNLWRLASFGGFAGEPMAHCRWDGYPGRTGKIAYLNYRIHRQQESVTSALQRVETERTSLGDLQAKLELALKESNQ